MPKSFERSLWIRIFHLLTDMLLTAVSFALAFAVRAEIRTVYFFGSATSVQDYLHILILIVLIWWLLLDLQSAHQEVRVAP
ncbi:hypothetical protein IT157_02000, partial [bacterium]|nr:hypothetical protein [bacterium]